MNDDIKKELSRVNPCPLNVKETVCLLVLATALSFLSNGAFIFAALASGVYSVLFLSSKSRIAVFIPCVLSLGIPLFFTNTVTTCVVSAVSPLITGLILALCISKRKKVFTCIGITAVLTALFFSLNICAAVFDTYGSVINGFRSLIEEAMPIITETVLNTFNAVSEANGLDITLTEDDVLSLLKQITVFIPACIAFVSETLSAVVYITSRLLLKIRSRNKLYYPNGSDFSISVSTAAAFLISGLGVLLFSLAEDTEFVSYVFINACSLLIIPFAVRGIVSFIRSFKRPAAPSVFARSDKRHSAIMLVLIIVSAFINPLFGIIMLSSYGAFSVFNEALAKRISKKSGDR